MRAVLVAVGSRGDLAPFLALAERLVAEGHEAVVVSHASLLPDRLAGVDLRPVDSDPAALLRGPAARALRQANLGGLNRTRGEFAEFLASVAAPVAEASREADVVIASTFAMAGVAAARERGIPVVRVHLWPEESGLDGPMPLLPYSWRVPAPARRGARWVLRRTEPLLAGFDGWWAGGKLHIVPHHDVDFTSNDLGSLHAYSAALVTGAPANGIGPRRVTGWWNQTHPEVLSSTTSELLERPGPPWAFVGFGSMPQRSPDALVSLVEDACRRTGLRAVVQVSGEPTRIAADSPVHRIGAEPHRALFARMAVAVHHGGSGTTGAVVRAGIPSVVVPHVADQFYWAHRLHATGVAPRGLPRPLLTAAGLARRLRAALQPQVVDRARARAERVEREDGTGTAVRSLESLVRRG